MGITDLWSILLPGFDQRISFPIFVSKFIQEYGRTPRLAIDAYVFIFQSTHSNIVSAESEHDIQLRNIMSKLMYLTLLNVSYVVIFDGKYKPMKLRHGELVQAGISYDDILTEFQNKKFGGESYTENAGSFQLISKLKEILKENRIDYIQSPGEAEAECARLQKFGVVDFVLTDDTDVFVFGATNVLRNFRRSEKDITGTSATTKDYYVTPVDMQKVTRETGLDNKRLVLIASLRGGDYSNGVSNIGITRATKIALCGTKFAVFYHMSPRKTKKFEKKLSEPLPDFSKLLISCFIEEDNISIFDPYALIKTLDSRRPKLRRFIDLLNGSIKSRSREIFDMDIKFSSELFIDEYYTLLYLFPIISPKIFKFLPGSLSFSEKKLIPNDLHVPKFSLAIRGPRAFAETVPRFNNTSNLVEIGVLKLSIYVDESEKTEISNVSFEKLQNFREENYESSIPADFKFGIKSILVKILLLFDNYPELSNEIKIANLKILEDTEFVMLKYNPDAIKNVLDSRLYDRLSSSKGTEFDIMPLKGKLETIWLPKNLIKLINFRLIRDYEVWLKDYAKQNRRSPTRYKRTQRTTLDSLGLIANSKIDRLTEKKNLNEELMAYPSKLSKSPGTRRKSPRKLNPLPGQSFVTSFFLKASGPQDNPFLENSKWDENKNNSLFVSDTSDNEIQKISSAKDTYKDLKLKILLKPELSNREVKIYGSSVLKTRKLTDFDQSPPTSPSKRQKHDNRNCLGDEPIEQKLAGTRNLDTLQAQGSPPLNREENKEVANRKKKSANCADIRYSSGENLSNTEIQLLNDSDSDVNTSSLMEISFRSFKQQD